MQLHLPTHSETTGLYTGTEYDDIRLGEWRVVWSYCPRRHRYVRDLAAPILAAQGIAADDPDAAIAPERIPGDGQDTMLERIIAFVGDGERTVREVAGALGISTSTARHHLRDKRVFAICGRRVTWPFTTTYRVINASGVGKVEDYHRQQQREREGALVARIRERGDLTYAEAGELLSVDRTTVRGIVTKSQHLARYKLGRKHMITLRGDEP